MFKALLLAATIIGGTIIQNKHLGSYYVCETKRSGRTQELWLYKNDSFTYQVKAIGMNMRGRYRVSYDSLILTNSRLPLIFHIKRDKLVPFNGHEEEPEWHLTKIK